MITLTNNLSLKPITYLTMLGIITSLNLTGCNNDNNSSSLDQIVPTAAVNVAVFGDMPYGADQTELKATPAFIDSINNDNDIAFAMHGGDIHSGSESCTEAYNRNVYTLFSNFKMPLVYTPGDNEWEDCNKQKQFGGTYNTKTGQIDYVLDPQTRLPVNYEKGDPVKNLQLVRNIFFAKPGVTLGSPSMTVHSQAYEGTTDSDRQYVENTWFMKGKTLYVTVNIPGGSNNGTDPWYAAPTMSQAQQDEVTARTNATKNWLNNAFNQATKNNATSMIILTQADMWDTEKTAQTLNGYTQYIDIIAKGTSTFGKPVLLLNGDSHIFRSDNPLVSNSTCVIEPMDTSGKTSGATATACSNDAYSRQPYNYNVPNFHRVTFHGSSLPLEWLKLTVNPQDNAANSSYAFGPFSWKRVIPTLNK